MRMDFHTHCFPDPLAARAIQKVGHNAGDLLAHTDGTLDGLAALMRRQGVDRFVVLNIATNARQMKDVNDFAARMNEREEVVGFGSVHPKAENVMEELERIKALGLKGVKFQFDYQGLYVDDPCMKPIYRKIAQLGLVTMIHAGFDYGFAPPYMAPPERIANALRWVDSPFIASHWGGLSCAEGVLKHLCGLPLYFDTSYGYGAIAAPTAARILEKHGVERFLFGSDCPWHTPEMELRLLGSLGLSESEMDRVCWKNGAALLGLDCDNKTEDLTI